MPSRWIILCSACFAGKLRRDDDSVQAAPDVHQVGRDSELQRKIHQLNPRLHLHLQTGPPPKLTQKQNKMEPGFPSVTIANDPVFRRWRSCRTFTRRRWKRCARRRTTDSGSKRTRSSANSTLTGKTTPNCSGSSSSCTSPARYVSGSDEILLNKRWIVTRRLDRRSETTAVRSCSWYSLRVRCRRMTGRTTSRKGRSCSRSTRSRFRCTLRRKTTKNSR